LLAAVPVQEIAPNWRSSTPLCPAGHLPRKGGDWRFGRRHSSFSVGVWRKPARQL